MRSSAEYIHLEKSKHYNGHLLAKVEENIVFSTFQTFEHMIHSQHSR